MNPQSNDNRLLDNYCGYNSDNPIYQIYKDLISLHYNKTLSCNYNTPSKSHASSNFNRMLNIFHNLMKYGQVTPTWESAFSLYNIHDTNQLQQYTYQLRHIIAKLLAKGLQAKLAHNLIFEFHNYKQHPNPRVDAVYNLLLNATLNNISGQRKYGREKLLAICFADALNKYNAHVLEILVNNFKISIHSIYCSLLELDLTEHTIAKQHCVNFIFEEISFQDLFDWQILGIFNWVINNQLSLTTKHLLQYPEFWARLTLHEDNLMLLALMYTMYKNDFFELIITHLLVNANIVSPQSSPNIDQILTRHINNLLNDRLAYNYLLNFLEHHKYSQITAEQQYQFVYQQNYNINQLQKTIDSLQNKILQLSGYQAIGASPNTLSAANLQLHNQNYIRSTTSTASSNTLPPPPPYTPYRSNNHITVAANINIDDFNRQSTTNQPPTTQANQLKPEF